MASAPVWLWGECDRLGLLVWGKEPGCYILKGKVQDQKIQRKKEDDSVCFPCWHPVSVIDYNPPWPWQALEDLQSFG